MEKNISANSTIKLIILDIFPSYNELNPTQEEMLLIFQGLNSFFDLNEILTTKKQIEIQNNNQSTIIVSLIKSNNIIATAFVNIKQGEQWVTFNYENKNKKINTNLALSLMDCIKLKLFCEVKSKSLINSTFTNINNSALNINSNSNGNFASNRNNKVRPAINQINLKISKRNINNKILLKGSPMKTNYDMNISKRSPKRDLFDHNNNFNFSTVNPNISNINMNPYTTISKCSIKKIDLNSSNKTRNSKIAKKKSIGKYTSLRTTTNNNFGIKKMNTSTCSLNTINKNKNNKKSRLTPDIEIKELHNAKNKGGSPHPMYKKKKLDEDAYEKLGKSNDKTFHYGVKTKNLRIKENNKNNNEDNIISHNKRKSRQMNYSNNILNINNENNNNMNYNTTNNKCRNVTDNNFNNTFNNTFNSINKQVLKSKLLYNSKTTNYQHINNTINSNSTTTTKKNDYEGSVNSLDEEEKNKTRENIKISEKVGIYTNKRIDIKKNAGKFLNKKINNQENKFAISQKNLINNSQIAQKEQNLITRGRIETNNDKKEEINIENKDVDLEKTKDLSKTDNNDEKKENNSNINKNENIDDNQNGNGNEEENEVENDDYSRIKEDFILLYNDDYVNNIQDDLLKLEIELFVEKMTELISCYHIQLEEKRLENQLLQNENNINSTKLKNINKLIKKLELIKLDYDISSKNSKKSLKKQDHINLILNKTEIELFKNLFPFKNDNEKKEKSKMLKDITLNILKKKENISLLSNNEKYNCWINLYHKINDITNYKMKNKNSNTQRLSYDNRKNNESSFNNYNNKSIDNNNNFLKNNSYYKLDNTYKKKLPISPIYPKNNKFIPSTEISSFKIAKAD